MSPQSLDDQLLEMHRRFASECNNRAWQLAEAASRSETEDDEMLAAAHAAAWHWRAAGTPHNVALAQLLLGQVQALLGQGGPALKCARAAHAFIMANDSPPWEAAFAHAVLAHAGAAAGDEATHRRHHAEAEALGDALADPEEREIFDATFRTVPRPAPPA